MNIIEATFKINLNILATFRLYPINKPTCFYRIQCYLVYFGFIYPVLVTGLIHLFINGEFGSPQSGYSTFAIIQTGCHTTKLLPFITNDQRIKKCIHFLESGIFDAQDVKHRKILEKCTRICQRNTKVYLASIIVGCLSTASKPFFEKEQKFPLEVWLPFDPTANFFTYGLVYAAIVSSFTYVGIVCTAIEPLIGGLACLAAGHLQILKDILQNLDENQTSMTIKNKIKNCVRYHNTILSFIKEYEKCFSPVAFSQLSGSVLVICFCCFQMSKTEPVTLDFFNMSGYLAIYLIQIYFYCYYGTVLHEESDSITTAIFMSNWYEYDEFSKKDLIQIMERSKRPITVTVGKILELSVVTFVLILRRAYSLLAVLNNRASHLTQAGSNSTIF